MNGGCTVSYRYEWGMYIYLENRNHCEYVSSKFYDIFQKYWEFSVCNNLLHIFWMDGSDNIHCETMLFLFEFWNSIRSLLKSIKISNSLLFLLKFHTTTSNIKISVNTFPKIFLKTSVKSTVITLLVITYFVFFGLMVWKKLLLKCISFL